MSGTRAGRDELSECRSLCEIMDLTLGLSYSISLAGNAELLEPE